MSKNILALALLLFLSKDARSSCCSQAASGGAGRLLAHERALIEVSSKGSFVAGSFDQNSNFSFGHKSLPYTSFEQNLHIMARVVDYFMPFIHVPVVLKKSEAALGGGLSDIAIGARSQILKEGYFLHWPSIALVSALKIPSGQKSTKEAPLSNVEITGSGTYQAALSLILEKDIASVTYGLSYGLLIESARLGHALSLTSNFLIHKNANLNFSLAPTFYGSTKIDGQKLVGSDQRKLTIALGYSLKLHSQLALNINVGSDVPLSTLGKNSNCEFFSKLAFRFGVF